MSIPVKIGAFRYDTTRALFDGSVTVDGARTTMATGATLPEIFERMVRHREFDAAELGLTFYLRTLGADAPFVALPAFPNRLFRHSAVYVNTASGIGTPADLAGKTIGEFGIYGQDPGVWIKGILMEEHGFDPGRSRWLIGDLDRPGQRFDFVSHRRPDGVDITELPEGKLLGRMLESGEIDALFSANVPQCVLDGSPRVARLFPDFEPVERDYFRRTGIFPIMHAVVVPRELVRAHPGLAEAIYQAFLQSKDVAADRYRRDRRLYEVPTMVPWLNALFERNSELMGSDWWPYGMAANRRAIDTYLRYFFEQGLSERRWTAEEIFLPELLST